MNLPDQFKNSTKVLFDVLDQNNRGLVLVSDIESKWKQEKSDVQQRGLVECLRQICNSDDTVTYDQFLEGLSRYLDKSKAPPKPAKPVSLTHRAVSVTQLHPDHDHYIKHGFRPVKTDEDLRHTSNQPQPQAQSKQQSEAEIYRRAVPKRRDSQRRHTLGSGVDGSTLRRSKLYEEERRMLLKGLQMIDKAREWYSRRLNEVSERLRYGNEQQSFTVSGSNNDHQTLDKHEERFNLEKLRVNELNQQILGLTEPTNKGGLLHMNLARPAQSQPQQDSQHNTQLLRNQNRMLTKEVSDKSDRIAQLEKDKALLLRDLFEVRSRGYIPPTPTSRAHTVHINGRTYNESTLMAMSRDKEHLQIRQCVNSYLAAMEVQLAIKGLKRPLI